MRYSCCYNSLRSLIVSSSIVGVEPSISFFIKSVTRKIFRLLALYKDVSEYIPWGKTRLLYTIDSNVGKLNSGKTTLVVLETNTKGHGKSYPQN